MKTHLHLVWLLAAAFVLCAVPAWPQDAVINGVTIEEVARRLDALERQNTELREQVRLLQQRLDGAKTAGADDGDSADARLVALEEKVELHDGRLSEQDQVKVETTQRVPIRLTGMILFNAFRNTRHANTNRDYPVIAINTPGIAQSGATLRQSVIGVDFQTPEAVLNGRLRGSLLLDLFGIPVDTGERPLQVNLNASPRLRTGFVEGQWGNSSLLVGQDKTIFSPREPNSLAQVSISPLSGAGNLYGWRPQIRFEQVLGAGGRQEVRAQIAVAQTSEDWPRVQPAYVATLEAKRPALEGHIQFRHTFENGRRVEIGSGFHRSATHVAQTSIPSRVYAVDWFVNPTSRVEWSGFLFTGRNTGKFGARAMYGFSIFTPSPGMIQAVPVRSHGGWTQVTFLATPRLSFNVFGGIDDPNDEDLVPGAISRNAARGANYFYRVAPNVVFGAEVMQTLTWYKPGQRPRHTHYDLYLAYLF